MKKLILSAAIIAFTGLATVSASEINNDTKLVTVQDSSTKTPVALADLPDPVKATLASDTYKAWTPVDAFWIKDATGEFYQVNVKQEEKLASIKINKEGTPIE
jgi:hypothetical protein